MAKSILQGVRMCYICGTMNWVEEHHIFGGPLRDISERNGFKVYLCHNHHNEPPEGAHFNKETADMLKRACQRKYEESHSREDFIKLIGKNYLGD